MTREREEITKEEAVEILKDCELNPCVPKDKEAADMAIKALKQQPCEDCINRATVLELINDVKRVDGFKEYAQYEYLFNQVDKMPSVQPQPSNDCISRAEALKMVDDMDIPEDMSEFEIKSHIGVEIGTLPPATPTRKKGHWIRRNNDYFDWYECSECGYGSDGEMRYNRLCDVRTKFCPDCGSQNLKGE